MLESTLAYLRSVDTIYEIETSRTTIGRNASNELVIGEKSVSGKHAVLDINKELKTVRVIKL
jgi:pSer/pThr/pTyr-binding forkhead associated (FHA) protein